MNITRLTGANAYRANVAAPKAAKKNTALPTARAHDRVELAYEDVLRAEHEGYIEVNGNRFAVSDDMASQMRRA